MTTDRHEDAGIEEILDDYFAAHRANLPAMPDLWDRFERASRPAQQAGWNRPSLRNAGMQAALATAIALALIAAVTINPWSEDGPSTASARAILERAQAAIAAPHGGVGSVVVQVRDESAFYPDRDSLDGTLEVSEVTERAVWWESSTRWRSEMRIEYLRDGAAIAPGDHRGGVTVSDGEHVWTYSDIVPGIDPATGEETGPVVHVQTIYAPGMMPLELPLAGVFAMPIEGFQDTASMAEILGSIEDCFRAELDGTDVVAGRETHVVRLRPHNVGERVTGVRHAGTCDSLVRLVHQTEHGNEEIAEQTLTLWIDTETFLVLKTEQMVYESWVEGEPATVVSVERHEVMALEYDAAIDPERFTFTPPPGVEVIDWR